MTLCKSTVSELKKFEVVLQAVETECKITVVTPEAGPWYDWSTPTPKEYKSGSGIPLIMPLEDARTPKFNVVFKRTGSKCKYAESMIFDQFSESQVAGLGGSSALIVTSKSTLVQDPLQNSVVMQVRPTNTFEAKNDFAIFISG
jgi:hypothetical protein